MADTYQGRGGWARSLFNCSYRLLRLIELDAPEEIIAKEVELVELRLAKFKELSPGGTHGGTSTPKG